MKNDDVKINLLLILYILKRMTVVHTEALTYVGNSSCTYYTHQNNNPSTK